MSRIELDKQTRTTLARQVTLHLKDELGVEIDPFDSLALIDYLSDVLGPHYYNQGLHDAQAIVQKRVESIVEAVWEIEKPIERER